MSFCTRTWKENTDKTEKTNMGPTEKKSYQSRGDRKGAEMHGYWRFFKIVVIF